MKDNGSFITYQVRTSLADDASKYKMFLNVVTYKNHHLELNVDIVPRLLAHDHFEDKNVHKNPRVIFQMANT